ncbi:epithelial cell-transforming sequence 2 oncogene-like [Amphiura filiformis]|uniref:epithelial cell-transforming sequence 2 oncogene-like n=1 Tax=Amphiura filiformis TaxID=82378 RepID=UPI003B219EC0
MTTRTKDVSRSVTSPSGSQNVIASLKEPTFPTQRMTQSVKKTALIAPLPTEGYATRKVRTLHSQWTPVLNKSKNDQIFVERRDLIGHWFALWTDAQRKRFLDYILYQCKRSQLHYLQSWFNLRIPVKHADFTMYLPRFISVYIFSFLDPRSMSQAAMVCWHWRFLTEQDELWMPKCVRLGWLLPYVPQDKEYGAWKAHYIKCLRSLNVERHEQQDTYGLLGDGQKNKSKKKDRDDYVVKAKMTPWLDPDSTPTDLQRGYEAMAAFQNPNAPTLHGSAYYMQMSNVKRHQRSWTEPTRAFEYGLGSTGRKGQHRAQADDLNSAGGKSKLSLTASLDMETDHDPLASTLEPKVVSPLRKPVTRRKDLSGGGSHYKRHVMSNVTHNSVANHQKRVLLLSSRLPSVQLLLASVRSDVHAVLYDYDGATLEGIEEKLLETLDEQDVQSLGIFTSGIAEIELTPYTFTNVQTIDHPETKHFGRLFAVSIYIHQCTNILDHPEAKHFWETLCSHLTPSDSGSVDVFVPLAATDSGSSMLWQLGRLTGMKFTSPLTTSASSNYAHILGEWQGHNKRDLNPVSEYFQLDRLEAWLAMSDRVQEATIRCQEFLRPYFKQTQDQILADMLGELIFNALPTMHSQFEQVTPALMQALSALESQPDVEEPVNFLSRKLMEYSGAASNGGLENGLQGRASMKSRKENANIKQALSDSEGGISEDGLDQDEVVPSVHLTRLSTSSSKSSAITMTTKRPMRKLALKVDYQLGGSGPDRRKAVAQQLVLSEESYYQQLRVIRDVYYKPLLAALNSNNAIISLHNLKMIFTDVNNLVPVSKQLLEELKNRLDQWGPQQCIGDCFVKFQGKLKTFTNFHNNYPNALGVLDKCHEQQPAFRGFLKTHDRSPNTHMKTLAELMLAPTRRIMDYSRLLVALQHWTPEEHADRQDLALTLDVFKQLRKFGDECKYRLEHEAELLTLQKRIKNCPSLLEANRYLITEQHLAQWEHTSNNNGPKGVYDHTQDLAAFLFNDALVITRRNLRHIPYTQRCETRFTYHSSVALSKLLATDIPDTKYLQNAFTLKTPKREWLCSTESYDNKVGFIALLEDAIQAASEDD